MDWPEDWDRTPPTERTRGPYKVEWDQALSEAVEELERMGAESISVDRELGSAARVSDPGVVVRWEDDTGPRVMACDAYSRKTANLRAIGLTVRDLRLATTRGVIDERRAFEGLSELPDLDQATIPGSKPPHEVLGLNPNPGEAESARRSGSCR